MAEQLILFVVAIVGVVGLFLVDGNKPRVIDPGSRRDAARQ